MKFSENTIKVLKNFSNINNTVILFKGDHIRVASPQKTVIVEAKIDENIPQEVGIYDLRRFMSALQLYADIDVEFGEHSFELTTGITTINYTYCDLSMITAPTRRKLELPETDFSKEIDWDVIVKLQRAAGVLQLSHMKVWSNNDHIFIGAVDPDDPTADTVKFDLGPYTGDDIEVYCLSEYMNIIEGEYTMNIDMRGIFQFKSDRMNYIITGEAI